jgi:spore maturation protein CgeB
MNIVFFGSSLVSAYWNGAATYYRGIIRALHARGHHITFFEPDAYERQAHRDLVEDPPWARVVVYSADETGVWSALEQARLRKADLVVKCSGVGVFDDLLETAVLDLGGPDTRVCYWDVDAPATLERLRADEGDPFRSCVPRYDLVLTYGGGEPVIRGYGAFGARRCVPIYNALDPQTHFPVDPDAHFAADLTLLANRLPDREARVEEFFLRAASLLPEHAYVLAGNGWADKPMAANVRYLGHLGTAAHNALNCSARAVLNVARDSMAQYGFSPATRVFEAAGAGACIISDAWEGMELFLEPGREVLVAHDGLEVASLLRDLSLGQARAIGTAARRRVLAEHTYAQRAVQCEEVWN